MSGSLQFLFQLKLFFGLKWRLFCMVIQPFEAYSEPCQTSKKKHFGKIGDVFLLLTDFVKRSILDV